MHARKRPEVAECQVHQRLLLTPDAARLSSHGVEGLAQIFSVNKKIRVVDCVLERQREARVRIGEVEIWQGLAHDLPAEGRDRRAKLRAAMAAEGLDAILLFAPESQYWTTGYDTFGFAAFQCMVATSDGRVVLLTRAPDRWTAEYTSNVDDVRIWTDVEGVYTLAATAFDDADNSASTTAGSAISRS